MSAGEQLRADRIIIDAEILPGTVVEMVREDALCLSPEKLIELLGSPERLAREVHGLLRIISVVNSITGFVSLEMPLFELIFDLIPAERGVIVLRGPGEDASRDLLAGQRESDKSEPVRLCKGIVDRVTADRVAVLCNNLKDRRSGQTRACLAAPFVVLDRVLGLIYLDSCQPQCSFGEANLYFLLTIAGIVAYVLENERSIDTLESENRRLRSEITPKYAMVGTSAGMQAVHKFIRKVAPTRSTVLILGESGTGKELVARAIHESSPRAGKPFAAVNCAAITETLLESELFGYEKGAFTGAAAQTKGKFEVADRGTLFLDEIGELAPALQAKLLRVLQEHEFTRVGGTKAIKVDVRLITATNRDLEKMVRQGAFRADLFYRLNVVVQSMPPLRERREDIPSLAHYFVEKHKHVADRCVAGISDECMRYLISYDWPGNIRELENVVERALVLGAGALIGPEDLPDLILELKPAEGEQTGTFHASIRRAKQELILKSLDQANGNVAVAARNLGLNPTYLYRLIRNLDLENAIKSSQEEQRLPGGGLGRTS